MQCLLSFPLFFVSKRMWERSWEVLGTFVLQYYCPIKNVELPCTAAVLIDTLATTPVQGSSSLCSCQSWYQTHDAALNVIMTCLHLISHYCSFPLFLCDKMIKCYKSPVFLLLVLWVYANSLIISCVFKRSSMMQLKKSVISRRLNRGSFSALRRPCCWWHAEVNAS